MRRLSLVFLFTFVLHSTAWADPMTWVFSGDVTSAAAGSLTDAFPTGTAFTLELTADLDRWATSNAYSASLGDALSWTMTIGGYTFYSTGGGAVFGLWNPTTGRLMIDGSLSNNPTVLGDALPHDIITQRPDRSRNDGPWDVVLSPMFNDMTLFLPVGDTMPTSAGDLRIYFFPIDRYGRWEDLQQESLFGRLTSVEPARVPAPASLLVMGLGATLFGLCRRRLTT
jgi:hypothetical protein